MTTNTFDSGGNLKTSTDARAAITTYTLDALNRVQSVAYKIGATTDQTITFGFDAGANGKGRLTSASDASHSLAWTYDAQGRVLSKSQTVGTVTKSVSYVYTSGRLTSMTTPSGQAVVYGYNANNQITSVTVNGTTVLSNALYEPFGPTAGWTWGNGTIAVRSYDTDGKITQVDSGGLRTYGYDDAFRITGITDTVTPANSWSYGYDGLDRLTSATKTGTTQGWTYDANGNRLTQTGTTPSTYTVSATNNRITSTAGALARSYTYNAVGSALTYSTVTATYKNSGRLKTLKQGTPTSTYVYNALGQLVKQSGGAPGTVLYLYDEAGHVLGEYSSTGALVQETVWLGDIPAATLRPGTPVGIFYVHTDHLNTPRKITQPSDNGVRWTWESDPFGTNLPNENPASLGVFKYNLRFPGQMFDGAAGLHQNWNRDYDPAIGKYVESDPIGLKGGINTYGYAGLNPLSNIDPLGLECASVGGFMYCQSPGGGPEFRVPAPAGASGDIGPDNFKNFLLYHNYDVQVPLNGADPVCVMRKMIESPTPGKANPAKPNGTRNNAQVFGFDNWVTSYLTSDLGNRSPLVVNVADGGSLFPPGYVARTVRNGVAHTYGEGLAWSQAIPNPSALGNWYYWQRQMERFVKDCGCKK